MVWRWTDLRTKCQRFEKDNKDTLLNLREAKTEQETRMQDLEAEAAERHRNVTTLSEQKGQLLAPLKSIEAQDTEFKGFPEQLERAALSNLKQEVRELELQLASAEGESLRKPSRNFDALADRVKQKEYAIARFDHLAVTASASILRMKKLNTIFRLLNRDLLEIPVGKGGVTTSRQMNCLRGCVTCWHGFGTESIGTPSSLFLCPKPESH